MKKLTFNNENERKGAELILDNIIAGMTTIKWRTKRASGNELIYKNVPELVFTLGQGDSDWAYIEEIGKFRSLGEYYEGIEPRFDSAEDKDSEVTTIKSELNELIK